MATFIETVNRIALELRRSNMTAEIKSAINDAILEAAGTRFYFNEMRGVTFNSVIGTEYYTDGGLVEIDAAWYIQGGARYNLRLDNNLTADSRADGNVISGTPTNYSRQGVSIRLYPVPSTVLPFYFDGFGKLTPTPLAADADTNNWLTEGELYIRALAKRNILRDVIKDYGEARLFDATAADYRNTLIDVTTQRLGTGVIRATDF